MSDNPFQSKPAEPQTTFNDQTEYSVLDKVGKRDDLSSLPPELVAAIKPIDDEHQQVVDIVVAREGIASLNEIVIDLWRASHEEESKRTIPEKPKVQNKVNKLLKDGHLHRVIGRKGVYSTQPMSIKAESKDAEPEQASANPFS